MADRRSSDVIVVKGAASAVIREPSGKRDERGSMTLKVDGLKIIPITGELKSKFRFEISICLIA
jgi:hypothetical protein